VTWTLAMLGTVSRRVQYANGKAFVLGWWARRPRRATASASRTPASVKETADRLIV
jgi:hypothetical protein